MSENPTPTAVNVIADKIINDLSLNERVTMANLKDDQIAFINELLAEYIRSKSKKWATKQGEPDTWEVDAIVKVIWKRLQQTHRLRIVK